MNSMKYLIILIITGLFCIFNIINFTYTFLKLGSPNFTEKDRKNIMKKLYIYGLLMLIFGLAFSMIALNCPGPGYLK